MREKLVVSCSIIAKEHVNNCKEYIYSLQLFELTLDNTQLIRHLVHKQRATGSCLQQRRLS